MPDSPCPSTCDVNDMSADCLLQAGHEHEHEANLMIAAGEPPDDIETLFIVWWGDDGHAFVGSDKAVDTGKIT